MTDPNNNQDSVGGKAGANTVENKGVSLPNPFWDIHTHNVQG